MKSFLNSAKKVADIARRIPVSGLPVWDNITGAPEPPAGSFVRGKVMLPPTVVLLRTPTRADFYAAKDRADETCECQPEAKLMAKETGPVLCASCRARKALNELMEVL